MQGICSIPNTKRNKQKPKSLDFIFLVFKKEVMGYKLWDLKNKKKILGRDVVSDEINRAKDVRSEEDHVNNHTNFHLSKEGTYLENHTKIQQALVE